jgi:hypothetical protein
MKTEQAAFIQSIAQGRLITLSQWDGSAFQSPEQRGILASERSERRADTEVPGTEETAPAPT